MAFWTRSATKQEIRIPIYTFILVVVSVVIGQSSGATIPTSLDCYDKCLPGYHRNNSVSQQCLSGKVFCSPCGKGTYVDVANTGDSCFLHTACRYPKIEIEKGTETSDTKCICQENFYKTPGGDCRPWTKCKKGYGVVRQGSSEVNVQCQECVTGTFSDTEDSFSQCLNHTSCEDEGYEVQTPGSKESDTKCRLKSDIDLTSSLSTVTSATSTLSITEGISNSSHSSIKNSSEKIATTQAPVKEANVGNLNVMAIVLGVIIVFILLCIFLYLVRRRPQSRPQGGREDQQTGHVQNPADGRNDRPCLANGQPPTANLVNGQLLTGNLANDQPPTANLANGQLPTGNLANGQPPTGNLANGQPPTGNLANGQPPTANLANDHPSRIASAQPLQSTCKLPYYYPSTSNDANSQPPLSNPTNGQSQMSNNANGQPTISNHTNGQPPMSNLANDLPPMGNHASGQTPRNDHANGQPSMRDHANDQTPVRDHTNGFVPTSPYNVAYSQPVQNFNFSVNVNVNSGQMSNPPEINVSAKKDEDPTNGDNKDNHGRDEEDDSLPAKGMQETLSQPDHGASTAGVPATESSSDHGAPTAGVPATESSTDHSAPSAGVPATESSSDHGAPTAGVPATESPTDNDTNSHAEGNPQVHKQCTDDPEGNIDDLYEKEAGEPISEIPLDEHNACDDQEQQRLLGDYEMTPLNSMSSAADAGEPVFEQTMNDAPEQERLLQDYKMVPLDSD